MTLDELKAEIKRQGDNYSTVIFPSKIALAMFLVLEEQQKALLEITEGDERFNCWRQNTANKALESTQTKLKEL